MPRVVFDEELKTGLCSKIGQQQQKCQRKPAVKEIILDYSLDELERNKTIQDIMMG